MTRDDRKRHRLSAASLPLMLRLWREHLHRYAWPLGLALMVMCVVGATQGAQAWLIEPIFDDVFDGGDLDSLYLAAALLFLIAAGRGVTTFIQSVLVAGAGARLAADVQNRMFSDIVRGDLARFQEQPPGEMVSRFVYDSYLMRDTATRTVTTLGRDTVSVIALLGVMFYQDWQLALVATVIIPLAAAPIVRLGRRIRRASKDAQADYGRVAERIGESFRGIRQVIAYDMADAETARTHAVIDTLRGNMIRVLVNRALTHPVMEALAGLCIAGVVIYGGQQVLAGENTKGAFLSFLTAALMAYQPLKSVAGLKVALQEGLAAVERMFQLADAPPTVVDAPNAAPLAVTQGEITFTGLHYAYPDGRRALFGLDLTIAPGQTVALVGPSGAGKTTLYNLLLRFYDPSDGRILIDGQDIAAVTQESLRAQIAFVGQETQLFDDSVRANIAYGRADASDADIEAAARAAQAHAFIMDLPDGYATRVGPDGGSLSGGQRQRIAVARAFLRDAPILLLDEATSALDTESERAMQKALEALTAGRTTLVIAHRLSTVRHADMICVMDKGRIVETGSHGDLLAREGLYARLNAHDLGLAVAAAE